MRRKFLAILGLILSVCFAMSVSLLPLKVGKVLDYITTASEADTTKNVSDLRESVYGLGYLVGSLAVFTFLRFLSLQFLQEFLAMDMRNDFYRRFMSNDLYFFEQYKSGELVSRLSSDVNQAKSAVSNNLTYLIRSVVIICSNIIILFTISWKLTCLVMMLVPIYSVITLQYSKRNKVLVKQYQDVQAEVSAAVA
jgi:ABC-type multidrug transport system fused ATPase/permease subunit